MWAVQTSAPRSPAPPAPGFQHGWGCDELPASAHSRLLMSIKQSIVSKHGRLPGPGIAFTPDERPALREHRPLVSAYLAPVQGNPQIRFPPKARSPREEPVAGAARANTPASAPPPRGGSRCPTAPLPTRPRLPLPVGSQPGLRTWPALAFSLEAPPAHLVVLPALPTRCAPGAGLTPVAGPLLRNVLLQLEPQLRQPVPLPGRPGLHQDEVRLVVVQGAEGAPAAALVRGVVDRAVLLKRSPARSMRPGPGLLCGTCSHPSQGAAARLLPGRGGVRWGAPGGRGRSGMVLPMEPGREKAPLTPRPCLRQTLGWEPRPLVPGLPRRAGDRLGLSPGPGQRVGLRWLGARRTPPHAIPWPMLPPAGRVQAPRFPPLDLVASPPLP